MPWGIMVVTSESHDKSQRSQSYDLTSGEKELHAARIHEALEDQLVEAAVGARGGKREARESL